jgi:hypothetical protein
MCVPPYEAPPEPHFHLLADAARRTGLSRLSMGMSSDYLTAIALGATHVRVGSAIFGARPPLGAPRPGAQAGSATSGRPAGPGVLGKEVR